MALICGPMVMEKTFNVIDHDSSLIFSVKTFRPLWVWPWHSSVWRQFPMRNCMATIKYSDDKAAMVGHRDLTKLLTDLNFADSTSGTVRMADVVAALEKYAQNRQGEGVKSYRIWALNELESKLNVKLTQKRCQQA